MNRNQCRIIIISFALNLQLSRISNLCDIVLLLLFFICIYYVVCIIIHYTSMSDYRLRYLYGLEQEMLSVFGADMGLWGCRSPQSELPIHCLKMQARKHNIHAWKAGASWRHEFAIYCYKLTIHFHIWLFLDAVCELISTMEKSQSLLRSALSSLFDKSSSIWPDLQSEEDNSAAEGEQRKIN